LKNNFFDVFLLLLLERKKIAPVDINELRRTAGLDPLPINEIENISESSNETERSTSSLQTNEQIPALSPIKKKIKSADIISKQMETLQVLTDEQSMNIIRHALSSVPMRTAPISAPISAPIPIPVPVPISAPIPSPVQSQPSIINQQPIETQIETPIETNELEQNLTNLNSDPPANQPLISSIFQPQLSSKLKLKPKKTNIDATTNTDVNTNINTNIHSSSNFESNPISNSNVSSIPNTTPIRSTCLSSSTTVKCAHFSSIFSFI
jgi:hypothetical protein